MNRNLSFCLMAHFFLVGTLAAVVVDLCRQEAEDNSSLKKEVLDKMLKAGDSLDLQLEEIRQLRYEMVKAQILQKLHLKKAPCRRGKKGKGDISSSLPFRTAIEMLEHRTEDPMETDDGKGRPESFVVFPNNTEFECQSSNATTCSRFEFLLPPETNHLKSADLWLHRQSDGGLPLEISEPLQDFEDEIDRDNNDRLLTRENSTRNLRKGWVKFELPQTVTINRLEGHVSIVLEVSDSEVAEVGEERPFLAVTVGWSSGPRSRRSSAECGSNPGKGCCRESLNISFAAIGWDDWILHPPSYEANYCRGRCIHDISNSPNHYTSILYTFLKENSTAAESLGFRLCCTPSKMLPLSIFWWDEEKVIHHHILPNMIVESCDCA